MLKRTRVTKRHDSRPPRRLVGRRRQPARFRRLQLESMESRWLLSGSPLLQVTSMTPSPGAQLAEPPSEIVLTFNRAVGAGSLLLEHLHLEGSGGDGTFGDGNETVFRPTGLQFLNQTQVAVEWTGVTIPADQYRLHLGENPRHTFLEFDGIDDQVSTPLNIDQGPGSPGVTFEAWVNPTSPGDGRRHVISTDNGGFDWSILRENDQWHVFTGEGSRSTGFAVVEGRWQHLAAVFEPDRGVTFLMDGQESFIPYINYDFSDNNVTIGRNPRYPEFFAGAIDEVRVWNGTRTADEIRANMHQSLAGTEPELLGYWKFDEGQGQWVADSSLHGRHGVLGRDAAVGSDDPLWRTELSWPESLDGGMLDGEFTGSFPSGDGVAGGAFVAEFEILDVTPPWITKHSPAGNVVGPVDHVVLTFSEPIDPGSWGTGDVQLLDGSGTPITVSGVTQLDADRFRISFPPQNALESYVLTVAPEPADLSGNRLDQNRNGVGGEAEDVFQAGFTIVDASEYYFEGFSGELGPEWSFPELAGDGRIRFTTDFAVDPGGRGLMFDSSNASGDNVKSLNEAILTLDLSAFGDPLLTFHNFKLAGTSDPLDEIHVTGDGPDRPAGALGDGVSISNDGNTWYRMRSMFVDEINRRGDGVWRSEEYDLPAEVARINGDFDAGLSLDGVVSIKFSQYGARPFANEGWVIDNVRISGLREYVHSGLDRNVFHRFDVPGELREDLIYRVALIGDVTPQTPIFVSLHSTGGGPDIRFGRKYSHTWLVGALAPDAETPSLVIVNPSFVPGGRYSAGFGTLCWSLGNDIKADMALLSLVDHLASHRLGNGREIYIHGHSAAGQFTERFTWAHPDRVSAALVSAPGSRNFPDVHARYPNGIGPNRVRPAPEGVDLVANLTRMLDTRLIFRVGEYDMEYGDTAFQRYPMAIYQGQTRLHRAFNMYESLNQVADTIDRPYMTLDHQLVVMRGIGHSGTSNPAEATQFFRMMFAPKVEPNVFVHSRFVSVPTAEPARATLPAHVEQWQPGETLYLELWLNTPSETGIASGTTDLFIDSEVLTPISITHGALFPENRTGQIDVGTSWIRDVGGATIEAGVGSDAFALLARIEVQIDGEETLRQLAALPQSGVWMLGDGIQGTVRTLPLPYAERTVLGGEDLFGQIFDDRNLDGTLDPYEAGLADWTLRLLDEEVGDLAVPYRLTASDFRQNWEISKAIPQATISAVGGGSLGITVMTRNQNVGGVPTLFFCTQTETGYAYWWNEQNGFELRADFASPVWQVDVRAHGGWGFSQARMRAYDADGNMIAESFSGNLAGSATETFGVTVASPEIAYVIVTGVDSGVRLDELSFVSSVHAKTDEHGHFEFRDVPPGAYQIAVDLPAGWNLIRPINDGNTIHVGDDARQLLVGGAVSDNLAPAITGLAAAPDPVFRSSEVTLTASGVSDPDGQVVRVEFYRDGQLLGADTDGGDGWSLSVDTTGWALGQHPLSARAQDNDGAWSEPVNTTVTVLNAPPTVDALTVAPNPVTRPGAITLTAEGVNDPDGTVVQVEFYRNTISPDNLLGTVNSDGPWVLNDVSTDGWQPDVRQLWVRAQDDDGAWSEPVHTTVTIQNALPTIQKLTANPNPVTRPGTVMLSALDVNDPDGSVTRVAFYQGSISNDNLLGMAEDGDPWVLPEVSTADWQPGNHTLFARAQDNDGAWGLPVNAWLTVLNAPPTIQSLVVSPTSLTRPGQISLTAQEVSDPDGTVQRVEFYRETISPATRLGTVEANGPWVLTGVSTEGWDAGPNILLARAQDNDGAWSSAASATVNIENIAPQIGGLAAGPDPVERPGELTLTASEVSDPDGTVTRVEFYRGEISEPMRLGTVEANGPWVLTGVNTAGWSLGEQTLLARAQDNDGAWSEPVSTLVTVQNAVPVIESLSVSPDPVTRPGQFTLTASGVIDPDGTVARVEFYRETISDETRLGTVEVNGPWSLSGVSTAGWVLGQHTLLARAQDNDGAWSEPATTTVTVQNAVPVIASLSVDPDPVTRPDELTLTADGVHDPDGSVALVAFYRSTVSDETRLGTVEADGPWVLSAISTDGWELGEHTLWVRAKDNDGAWSDAISTTLQVENAVPSIGVLSASPDPVNRLEEVTLTAEGVHDPDGNVMLVEFYRGTVSEERLLGIAEGNVSWTVTAVVAADWDLGENTLVARAQDNDGAWSPLASTSITVANVPPVIEGLVAGPDPVTRPDLLAITATGVGDADGQVTRVAFYRHGEWLGDGTSGSDGWSLSVSTAGWELGSQTLSARARDDDGAWSEEVSTTVTLRNAAPVIESLSVSPDPLTRPGLLTLTADGVHDPDGSVLLVEFYRGTVSDETRLGTVEANGPWVLPGVSTDGWQPGKHILWVRAQDDDGAWSEAISTTVQVENAVPSIGALSASPDPVNRLGEMTLTAEGVHDPDGNVVLVEFYRGTVSEDTLLGVVEGDGTWTVTALVGADWDLGENTLVARAKDNDGAWSPLVSISITVANVPPVIEGLVAGPDPVTRPDLLTITATGVGDADGQVTRVAFYRHGEWLGDGTSGSDGWSVSVSTAGWELGDQTLSSRARDNDGAWSAEVSTTVIVENAIPTIDALAATPDQITRPAGITLSAEGVIDADGTVSRVEFYLGSISDETWLGTVEANGPWMLTPVGTAGWAPGEHTLLARAQDNDGAWSATVTTTVLVENTAPVVAGLSASPNPVTRPGEITLSATGVYDPDGTVVRVEFYQGQTLLGVDEDGSDGWSWMLDADGWTVGEQTFWARAVDDDGAYSQPVSTMVMVQNAIPVVGSLLAVPSTVVRPGEITLSASGVFDPDGTVIRVEFYHGDLLLGVDQDGSNAWSWTVDTGGWMLGEHTFWARAVDDDGAYSEPVSTMVTVQNAIPVVEGLLAVPSSVTRPGEITLTATGLDDPDGHVVLVEFYRDHEFLGQAGMAEGWSWTGSTADWDAGNHTLSVMALDNDGARSQAESATVQVYSESEPIDFGAVPVFSTRARTLNISNPGTGPLVVEGLNLELPFAILPADESGGHDDWIVASGATKAFIVSYRPTEDGWHQATLTMTGEADGRAVQISGWAASGHQNPLNPYDVNGDGDVTPLDVLLLINEINSGGGGLLSPRTAEQPGSPFFFDVLGNGKLTPNDVLQVINYINSSGAEEEPAGEAAEGESDGDRGLSSDEGWLTMVNTDGGPAMGNVPMLPIGAAGRLPQTDLRNGWLTDAVDDLALWTTRGQPDLPRATWQRAGADVWQPDDSELADWETLLDDPATDLADLDAYFAALG